MFFGQVCGQFAGGFIIAEEHVGHALAFGARQPGRNKGVALVQCRADDHRPAGEQNGDQPERPIVWLY